MSPRACKDAARSKIITAGDACVSDVSSCISLEIWSMAADVLLKRVRTAWALLPLPRRHVCVFDGLSIASSGRSQVQTPHALHLSFSLLDMG